MIVVTKTDKATGRAVRVEIQEGKDPFEVCNAVARGLGFTIRADDPLHDEIMAERAAEDQRIDREVPNLEAAGSTPAGRATGVRETSRVAYSKAKWSGKLTRQQGQVVAWLRGRAGDATRQEIAAGTGLSINATCGRCFELMDEPIMLLVETDKRKCRITGETAYGLQLRS